MRPIVSVFLLGCLLAVPMLASDPNPTPATAEPKSYVEQLINEARTTEAKAHQVAAILKNKKSDPAAVTSQLDELSKHVEQIQNLVAQLESHSASMNWAQQVEFKRLKDLANLLNIFMTNKKSILESGDLAAKREEIRANAISIAVRAELIRKNAAKLRI